MSVLFEIMFLAMWFGIIAGCLYVAWVLLTDLFDGWSVPVKRFFRSCQYNTRTMFSVVTVFGVTFSLVRRAGVANTFGANLLVGLICLVWAVGIVCTVQFAVAEFVEVNLTPTKRRHVCDPIMWREATTSDFETEEGVPITADTDVAPNALPDVMTNIVDASSDDSSRRTSTDKVREHFRVYLTRDPKGVKASGFGRF